MTYNASSQAESPLNNPAKGHYLPQRSLNLQSTQVFTLV